MAMRNDLPLAPVLALAGEVNATGAAQSGVLQQSVPVVTVVLEFMT
ncbi:MAG: hypothetical protein HYX42_20885 [Polaromonas sp.]|nr:hypothetical protein [Polaromonas sp.]